MVAFDKEEFIEVKRRCENYIFWRTNLDRFKMREYFYNEKHPLKESFPDKNIEYCACEKYRLVVGDFTKGLKYVNEQGTYYMFLAANSYWAPVQDIAIGKAVNGTVYLMQDGYPSYFEIKCIEITEDYIGPRHSGFVPRSNWRTIYTRRIQTEQSIEAITDENWKCLEIAYEGVVAFSDLIPS